MVSANLKIINELKAFLEIVTKNPEVRKLIAQSDSDFSRIRKLPLESLVSLIINLPKRSLSIELQEFFENLGKPDLAATKGAFSLQRTKLLPLFFQVWNDLLVKCFYEYYGENLKLWRGFRLQAVDGSTAYLINREDVREYFGTQDNQHTCIPMARVMQIQDVLNDISIWGELYPIKTSEQAVMANRVSHLDEDSITLFDRGYPSYALMYLLNSQETPRRFVMRCKVGFNKEVRKFVESLQNDKIIELNPTANAISTLKGHGYCVFKNTAIKVRMVKVKLDSGQTEVLLTNLYEKEDISIQDLKELYGLRWGVETAFGKQKNQMQMEQFSGHRVVCILQDFAAGLVVANLQALIEKQCDSYLKGLNSRRKHDYKINKNISWASLKGNLAKLFLQNAPEEVLLKLQKAFERNVEPIRPGRQYKRIKKVKRLNGKYQTLTNYKRAI